MPRFVVERDIPGVGSMSPDELRSAVCKPRDVVDELAPSLQWDHSYVTGDRVFCVYIAEGADVIREHARRSGLPITAIHQVNAVIDPTTAEA